VGQGVTTESHGDNAGGEDEPPAKPEEPKDLSNLPAAAPWQRFILGTDEALERFNREHPDHLPGDGQPEAKQNRGSPEPDGPMGLRPIPGQVPGERGPQANRAPQQDRAVEAVDAAIGSLWEPDEDRRGWPARGELRYGAGEINHIYNYMRMELVGFTRPTQQRIEVSASLALAAMLARWAHAGWADRRARSRGRWAACDRWHGVQL
jgi:hypothetical protein